MVSPILIKKAVGMRFYWNIDANVGLNSPNKPDDVQLVQFGYALMAKTETDPALKAALAAVKIGTPCTGREDDLLVRAIRAHEVVHGGAKDGRVSVIPSSAGVYSDAGGKHSFLLISIVNNMFDAQPNDFPRIDKHPSCPAVLKGVVAEKCKL
jgi:hypothetical protein